MSKAEDLEMRINNRCLDKDYPYLSDLLGSDWICAYPLRNRSPEEYRRLAVEHAYRHYSNEH